MPRFIKGLELSRRFYEECVRPILQRHDPHLPYAAGLLGAGSEVLGFDDAMSTDHDWGPSVQIFLRPEASALVDVIGELMRHELPHQFMGYSTNYIQTPEDPNVKVMAITRKGEVNHRVKAFTIDKYILDLLGWKIQAALEPADWLSFPSQKLRALTSGAVHHDGIGDLTRVRAMLAWYPDDVWFYLMAIQWGRIAEEEHLMGRAGYLGDDLGAALIGSRIAQDLMRLCFLMERQYAPYPKWFGTGFRQLQCSAEIGVALRRMQVAEDWKEREAAYVEAAEAVASLHNALNITDKLSAKAGRFFNRPIRVINAGQYADALVSRISDKQVKALLKLPSPLGSIDQFSDDTGFRERSAWREKVKALYKNGV
jgi:hypothetical protein